MKIDTAGTYTLRYSATDQCGNVATKDRVLTVASKSTVLYSDGMLIINELPQDRAENEALHGAATNTYPPFNPNGQTEQERYVFTFDSSYWYNQRVQIKRVGIGSKILPESTAYWFASLEECIEYDLINLDTRNVTTMQGMFMYSRNATSIDISNFITNNATNLANMFYRCYLLKTILTSNTFDVSSVTSSGGMFKDCRSLVGGSGTPYDSSNPTDKTYARIDNPPDSPGYFTLKAA